MSENNNDKPNGDTLWTVGDEEQRLGRLKRSPVDVVVTDFVIPADPDALEEAAMRADESSNGPK